MLQGLGIYTGRLYGNRAMNPCFTATHWNGNKGWKWDKDKGHFLTPATRQKDANLRFDPNLAIEKLALMDARNEPAPIPTTVAPKSKLKKKRSRKKKGKSTRDIPDDDSATYIDPLKAKETSLLKKVVDHDDDSQVQATSGGHVKRKAVTQVNIPAPDEVSIASTLTMGSLAENPLQSDTMDKMSPNSSLGSTASSLKSVSNPAYFQSMLESGMTAEAIRERADTFYKHQVNKAQLGHQRALETFLASLPSPPVVTPHKSKKLTGSSNAGEPS
jgi:hypothetical protein